MLDIYKYISPDLCEAYNRTVRTEKFRRTFLSLQLRSTKIVGLCHSVARDQPQPGSFSQRPREAEKRDSGNEVAQNP